MIYLIILLSMVVVQILPDIKCRMHVASKSIIISKKYFIEALFIVELIAITVFRKHTVGADLRMYTRIFGEINKYSWENLLNSNFEFGYMIFTRFIRFFTNNSQVFIAITGIITVGFYLFEIVHQSKNSFLVIYLALTFGFFFFQFSMIRQAIAMSLLMFAIDRLKERKWLEYIIIVIIAATFHVSALVCIPLVIIVIFPWTDYVVQLLWGIEIAVLVMLKGILEIIVYYIPRYSYVLNEKSNYQLGYLARILIISGLYLGSVFFYKVGRRGYKIYLKKEDDRQGNFMLILGSIGTMLMPMITYFESAQRMTYYFVPYVFWCVDLAADKSKWMRRMMPIIYVLLGTYYILSFTGFTSMNNAFNTNNYLFFWQ